MSLGSVSRLPKALAGVQMTPQTESVPQINIIDDINKEEDCKDEDEPFFLRAGASLIEITLVWSMFAAFFVPTGWAPDEALAKIVTPGILSMLPYVYAFVAGHLIYGVRGGTIAALFTLGSQTGVLDMQQKDAIEAASGPPAQQIAMLTASGHPPLFDALYLAPLAAVVAYYISAFGKKVTPYLPLWSWLQMFIGVIDSLAFALLAFGSVLLAFYAIAPFSDWYLSLTKDVVETFADAWVPLANLVLEPNKLLFLNRAVNEQLLVPRATTETAADGKSVYFLLDSNPGPGFGVLLAFLVTGGVSNMNTACARFIRRTAPLAMVIQFFGGIHEVYFIYVLLRPRFILSLITGGFVGSAIFTWGNAGLTGPPMPASIMEIADKTPSDSVVAIVFGVLLSAVVSFVVSWALVRTRCNFIVKRLCNFCTTPCNILDHYV